MLRFVNTTVLDVEKMLPFESLLLKELQKQQSRAEFCDVVLHTQGVSVPVHSCVLSAFSPWLCGALSTMPSSGQKRLIEVQAKDACTLLSLVTLLYSGQFDVDKEDVLSAACKLGIDIPKQDTACGNKGQDGKERTAAGAQAEDAKKSVERECQTEILCTATLTLPSESQHAKQTVETVNVIDLSSWRSAQGLDPYSTACDIALTNVTDKLSSFHVVDGVPETSMYPTVSAPACAPQGYTCPPDACSAPQPPHLYPSYDQGQSALGGISQGEDYGFEGLEQFENNIPGFINFFLKANSTQATEQRGQRRMRGDVKAEGTARRARRARPSTSCAFRSEGLNVKKVEEHTHRFGRVPHSIGTGQGGGRVGRMLDTRRVQKTRRQGRGAIYQVEGQAGRSSTRGRPRKRQGESRIVDAEGQVKAQPIRRQRGRPCKRPLPQNTARSEMSSSKKKATNPPAPSLMHTAALPAASQTGLTQPLDWLIDDVIAQLPFLPPVTSNNPEGIMNTTSLDSHPRTQTLTKVADLDLVQAQPEGEFTDILDSFLRTFEQHIGAGDSDVRDGMPDGSQSNVTHQHSAQNDTILSGISDAKKVKDSFRASSVNTTTSQGPRASFQNRQKISAYRPSCASKVSVVNIKKLKGRQSERSETQRMTRSQSRKRKLEYMEEQGVKTSPVNEKKKQRRHKRSESKYSSSKIDAKCNVASALRKVMKMPRPCRLKPKQILDRSESSESRSHEESSHAKRNGAKNLLKEGTLTKTTFTESHPETALSAFELMRNLLENQRKKEEQKNDDNKCLTAERQIERGKPLVRKSCVQGDKKARTSVTTYQQDLGEGQGKRQDSYSKPGLDTVDSPIESPFRHTLLESSDSHATICSTEDIKLQNFTAMPSATDPAVPREEPGHTESPTDSSEEDVDVVEISSSLSESSVAQPVVADIVISSEEEEEDAEIDVLDLN